MQMIFVMSIVLFLPGFVSTGTLERTKDSCDASQLLACNVFCQKLLKKPCTSDCVCVGVSGDGADSSTSNDIRSGRTRRDVQKDSHAKDFGDGEGKSDTKDNGHGQEKNGNNGKRPDKEGYGSSKELPAGGSGSGGTTDENRAEAWDRTQSTRRTESWDRDPSRRSSASTSSQSPSASASVGSTSTSRASSRASDQFSLSTATTKGPSPTGGNSSTSSYTSKITTGSLRINGTSITPTSARTSTKATTGLPRSSTIDSTTTSSSSSSNRATTSLSTSARSTSITYRFTAVSSTISTSSSILTAASSEPSTVVRAAGTTTIFGPLSASSSPTSTQSTRESTSTSARQASTSSGRSTPNTAGSPSASASIATTGSSDLASSTSSLTSAKPTTIMPNKSSKKQRSPSTSTKPTATTSLSTASPSTASIGTSESSSQLLISGSSASVTRRKSKPLSHSRSALLSIQTETATRNTVKAEDTTLGTTINLLSSTSEDPQPTELSTSQVYLSSKSSRQFTTQEALTSSQPSTSPIETTTSENSQATSTLPPSETPSEPIQISTVIGHTTSDIPTSSQTAADTTTTTTTTTNGPSAVTSVASTDDESTFAELTRSTSQPEATTEESSTATVKTSSRAHNPTSRRRRASTASTGRSPFSSEESSTPAMPQIMSSTASETQGPVETETALYTIVLDVTDGSPVTSDERTTQPREDFSTEEAFTETNTVTTDGGPENQPVTSILPSIEPYISTGEEYAATDTTAVHLASDVYTPTAILEQNPDTTGTSDHEDASTETASDTELSSVAFTELASQSEPTGVLTVAVQGLPAANTIPPEETEEYLATSTGGAEHTTFTHNSAIVTDRTRSEKHVTSRTTSRDYKTSYSTEGPYRTSQSSYLTKQEIPRTASVDNTSRTSRPSASALFSSTTGHSRPVSISRVANTQGHSGGKTTVSTRRSDAAGSSISGTYSSGYIISITPHDGPKTPVIQPPVTRNAEQSTADNTIAPVTASIAKSSTERTVTLVPRDSSIAPISRGQSGSTVGRQTSHSRVIPVFATSVSSSASVSSAGTFSQGAKGSSGISGSPTTFGSSRTAAARETTRDGRTAKITAGSSKSLAPTLPTSKAEPSIVASSQTSVGILAASSPVITAKNTPSSEVSASIPSAQVTAAPRSSAVPESPKPSQLPLDASAGSTRTFATSERLETFTAVSATDTAYSTHKSPTESVAVGEGSKDNESAAPLSLSDYIEQNKWIVAVVGLAVVTVLGLVAFTTWAVCLYPPAYEKLVL